MRLRLPHRISEISTIVTAVLLGAVLVALSLILLETGLRSPVPAQRLGGADLVVGGQQSVPRAEDLDVALPEQVGVPADLVETVAAVPGVATAAGDLSFPAAIGDGTGDFLPGDNVRHAGHGWGSFLGGPPLEGHPPVGSDEVVLAESAAAAAGVSVGEAVEVALGGEPRTMRLSGVLCPTDPTAPADPADPATGTAPAHGTVLVSDDLARAVSSRAPGTVDLITVRTEAGSDVTEVADRVQQVVGDDLVVSSGADLGATEQPDAAAGTALLVLLVTSAGGVVLVLVGFLTGGAVSVMVVNRARELGLLRAIGATPAQVRSLMARQASAVALPASVAGVGLGHLLTWSAEGSLSELGLLVEGQQLTWSPWPALVTVLLLVGVVQAAARIASRRVSRLPATTAVVETETEPRSGGPVRTRIGGVLLALSLGSALVPLFTRTEAAIVGAASGALLSGIGLALVAPALVTRAARWLAPRQPTVSRWLAVRTSGSFATRTGGVVAVLALATGLTVTQIFANTSLDAVATHEAREGTIATAQVTADRAGGVPQSLLEEVEQLPSVAAAVPVVHSSAVRTTVDGSLALDGSELQPMLAVGPGVAEVLDPALVDGALSDLVGDTVAVDASLGWPRTVEVGDTVSLALADGTRVHPTVVATYRHGFGFGQILASRDLLPAARPHDVVLVAGADPAGVERDLAALATARPGVEPGPPQGALAARAQQSDGWLNVAPALVLFGYILLGVANRLVATTLRRRREWQLLGALGATPRQLWAMVAAETGLIVAGAVLAGLVISLVPMSLVSLGFLGTPWPQGPLWAVAAIVLVVMLTAAVASLVPSRHLLRATGPMVPAG